MMVDSDGFGVDGLGRRRGEEKKGGRVGTCLGFLFTSAAGRPVGYQTRQGKARQGTAQSSALPDQEYLTYLPT